MAACQLLGHELHGEHAGRDAVECQKIGALRSRERRVAVGFRDQTEGDQRVGELEVRADRIRLGDREVGPADEPAVDQVCLKPIQCGVGRRRPYVS